MSEHPTSSHPFHTDRRIQQRDKTPRSNCPTCLNVGVSKCTTQIMEFTCPRGHTWTTTRPEAEKHAAWWGTFYTGRVTQ